MNNNIKPVLFSCKYKYEVLLVALVQHLFIGIFLTDLDAYTHIIWPINMLLLGMASILIYTGKLSWHHWLQNLHFVVVLLLPIGLSFFRNDQTYFLFLNLNYVVFFSFLFLELLKFLVRPGYINSDIISAAACGYFLLIELSVFLLQYFNTRTITRSKGLARRRLPKPIWIWFISALSRLRVLGLVTLPPVLTSLS